MLIALITIILLGGGSIGLLDIGAVKKEVKLFEQAKATLPFSDRQDFEEYKKGFIAAPEYKKIMADAGNVAWDMERYKFLLEPEKSTVFIHRC